MFIEILCSVFFVEVAYKSSSCEIVVNLIDSDLRARVWDSDSVSGMHQGIGLVLFAKELVSLIFNFPCFGFTR